jgi:site-specific recombinase XerD
MQNAHLLTPSQAAAILQINEHVLNVLVDSGQIPHIYIRSTTTNSALLRFNPHLLSDWLKQSPIIKSMKEKTYLERLKRQYETRYPDAIQELKALNAQFTEPRRPKGYNLTKVPNKKLGFAWYVRYIENGKLVPTRWSTHTNSRDLAEQFAIENRDKLLEAYKSEKKQKKISGELYSIMGNYYAKDSPYLQIDIKRGRSLGENARRNYHNFMVKKFVPYLKKNSITTLKEIDTPLLARLQNHLLRQQVKPQTINHNMSYIAKVFEHLIIEGYVSINPCASLTALIVKDEDQQDRGCYDVSQIRGVFNKRWDNELSYLLCIMIYTTDMRNCEISRLQVKDIIQIDDVTFINIPKSKTRYGARIVPLHNLVARKIRRYIAANNKESEDYVFNNGKKIQSDVWTKAYVDMGSILGYDKARLEAEHITYYSGRHFWKTLMNSENLGDVEECFMGHRVSNDVAKRYNHRDKQGQKLLVKQARKVFAILDKRLFKA